MLTMLYLPDAALTGRGYYAWPDYCHCFLGSSSLWSGKCKRYRTPVLPIYAQGTFETFDLDSATGMYDSFGGYIYFDTTNDTAGNNGAFLGNASTSGNFGTGTLNTAGNPGYGSVVTAFSDYVAVPFYGDSGTTLEAAPGEVIPTSFGNTVTISAVSAAPEPSAWAMMLLGIGAIGLALRPYLIGLTLLNGVRLGATPSRPL